MLLPCQSCILLDFFYFSYNIMNENDIEGEEDGISGMDGEVKVITQFFCGVAGLILNSNTSR